MPHLAPLSWALATVLFWALLLSLSASLWWQDTPKIPSSAPNPSNSSLQQKWGW